jgi:hypothetical protein
MIGSHVRSGIGPGTDRHCGNPAASFGAGTDEPGRGATDVQSMSSDRTSFLVSLSRSRLCALSLVAFSSVSLGFALIQSPAEARASSGGYTFTGGTAVERATVRKALAASAFDWSLVPAEVRIHIVPGGASQASKGQIWLGSALLDDGRRSWGVVQHEYAHQVDFFLFTPAIRATLDRALGGRAWWPAHENLRHDQYGAERFASTLAYAYWPSPQNTLIRFAHGEATAMAPPRFRRLMDGLLATG